MSDPTMIGLVLAALAATWLLRSETVPAAAPGAPLPRGLVLFVMVAIAAGLLFRLWGIGRSLWIDEFKTLWIVEEGIRSVAGRAFDHDGQGPFYYLIVSVFVALFGESEFILRLPSLLCGIGTAFTAHRAGLRLGGRPVAWLALALTWLSAFSVSSSADARPYALGMLCAAVMLHGFVRTVQNGDFRGRLLFILGGAGTLGAHYFLVFGALGIAAAYVTLPALRHNYPWRRFSFDVLAQGLLSLPLLPHLLALWERREWLAPRALPDHTMFLTVIGPLLFLLVAAYTAGARFDRHSMQGALHFSAVAVALAPVVCLGALAIVGINLLNARYYDAAIVPAALAVAQAMSRVPFRTSVIAWCLWAVVTSLYTGITFLSTGSFSGAGHQDWRSAAARLDEQLARHPAPVLFRSGYVEDDGISMGRVAPFTEAPLRSPGEPSPSWDVIPLTFSWEAQRLEEYLQRTVVPQLHGQPVFYFMGCDCASGDSSAGYAQKLTAWLQSHGIEARAADAGSAGGIVLLRFEAREGQVTL